MSLICRCAQHLTVKAVCQTDFVRYLNSCLSHLFPVFIPSRQQTVKSNMSLSICSSLASIFRVFSRNNPADSRAGDDPQARDIPTADEAQQHKLIQEPGKAVDNETNFRFFDDSDGTGDSKLPMEKMAKKIEEACKKHESSRRINLSIWCAKCNIAFRTVEERTHHIRHSPRHYCCLRGEGIVELRDSFDLGPHNISHHFQLFCSTCKEYTKAHIKTSLKHFSCHICDDVVQYNFPYSLGLHYKDRHPLQYCHICDRIFPGADDLCAHIRADHTVCRICHKDLLTPEPLGFHRRTCAYTDRSAQQENVPLGHYPKLGTSPLSSHDKVLKVAKEMRVKTHPDPLRRQGRLTEGQEKRIDAEVAHCGASG